MKPFINIGVTLGIKFEFEIQNDMEMKNMMMNYSVTMAKKQLEEHNAKGNKTTLSVFEVANLKDMINSHKEFATRDTRTVFFNFSNN
jgi:hypothetical protein